MKDNICTVEYEFAGYCNRSDTQFVLAAMEWNVEVGDANRWTKGDAIVNIDDDGWFTSNVDLEPVLSMTHEEAVEFVAASEWGKACEHLDYDGA